jgi:AraC-like DNA-binding protein
MQAANLHITIEVVEALVEYLRERQVDTDALLASQGISLTEGSDEGFLDFQVFSRLFEAAERETGDPYIGLHVGEGFLARHWGRLGYLIIAGSDGFEGLHYLERFARIVTNALLLKFEIDGPILRCTFGLATPRYSRHVVDYFTSSAFALSALTSNGSFRFSDVQFQHAWEGDASEYEKVLKAPCTFGASENCITVKVDQFASISMHRDPRLKRILEEHANAVLQRIKSDDEWLKQVRSFVVEALPNGLPSLKKTAEHFEQNERTFQRALARLGVNFQELIDELRMNLALEYMRNDYGFLDIALMLGYSEQSAFHRAFKRWTGLPPSRYKREMMK